MRGILAIVTGFFMSTVINLHLQSEQVNVLQKYGINLSTDPIYLIKGEVLSRELMAVDGYYTGHYIFFLDGSFAQHQQFLRAIFGSLQTTLRGLFGGISLYGHPAEKYRLPENVVTIDIVSELSAPQY